MNLSIFFPGFVGALAPEIIRLYNLRQSPQQFQTWYYLISVVYALLGGYVATIAPGVTAPWWAFAVGAGLVSVVQVAMKAASIVSGATGAGQTKGAAPAGAARGIDVEKLAKGDFWTFVRGL